MYNNDDLFDKEAKQELIFEKSNYTEVNNPSNEEFFDRHKDNKINAILLAIYVAIQFILVGVFQIAVYPEYEYFEEGLNSIDETVEVQFIVSDNIDSETQEIDEIYPYLVQVDGEFTNNYTKEFPLFNVRIELYDSEGNLIGSGVYTQEDFLVGDKLLIDDEFVSPIEPTEIKAELFVDIKPLFSTLITLIPTFLTALAFIFVDKDTFKRSWYDFKAQPGRRIGNILLGYLMVIGGLVIASYLLQILGVTGTSQNEMTIQTMFNDNALNLFLLFLALCVFTPIVEEVLYRKVIFNFVESKTNHIWGIIVTGAIFGLMHVIAFGDFIHSLPYIFMGLAFGYMYYKSNKNIYVVIGMHFINNFVSWISYVL